MNTITAIRDNQRRQQVTVFLDGKLAFRLKAEAVIREGLRVGQELSPSQVAALTESFRRQRCFDAALRYLSYRPRSESEMRERLSQRGFDGDTIAATLSDLKDRGLVDDNVFAQFWKDNRQSFRPRSRRLTTLELRRKGISADIIDQAVADIHDDESAYQAALKKTGKAPLPDYDGFRRRLSSFLQRRGFSYGVINHTVARVWQEQGSRD